MKTPVHHAFDKSDDELARSLGNTAPMATITASSSSRRGSLSRKSPSAMFESTVMLECTHMIQRRLSNQSNTSINFELTRSRSSQENVASYGGDGSDTSTIGAKVDRWQFDVSANGYDPPQRLMTSFEKLATIRYVLNLRLAAK